jgi:transposase
LIKDELSNYSSHFKKGVKESMNYLGIDISKDKFDVALLTGGKGKHKVFKNNLAGFERLTQWLQSHCVHSTHACMESTGRYGEDLAKYLCRQKHKVSIVNPACIKAYAQSQLKRTKTDKVDASLIARFCEMNEPTGWEPPSEGMEELVELTRRISHLEKLKTSENNHLQSGIRSRAAIESGEKVICSLDEEIKKMKKRISKIVDSDEDLKKKKGLLQTIPGVGERTAEVILSETRGMKLFENARQLAAYSGITPMKRQSGSSLNSKGSISRLGNKNLRTAMYFPAIVAKRCNPIIKMICERLSERGKSGKQVVCAAIRKLLHIVFGVLRSGKPFDPKYQNLAFST